MAATPLASDGKHIYAISSQHAPEEKNKITCLTVEIFELHKFELKKVSEFILEKREDTKFVGNRVSYKNDGGLLNHV